MYDILKAFVNTLKTVENLRSRCPIGILLNQRCSEICVKRLSEKKLFNFDQHRSLGGNHCLRCGDTTHWVSRCPTKWTNKSLRPIPFKDGVCGICGIYLTLGHASRLGEVSPLFHHDAVLEQTLDSSWRRPGRCKSGLGDMFYPLMYLAFKQTHGKQILIAVAPYFLSRQRSRLLALHRRILRN